MGEQEGEVRLSKGSKDLIPVIIYKDALKASEIYRRYRDQMIDEYLALGKEMKSKKEEEWNPSRR